MLFLIDNTNTVIYFDKLEELSQGAWEGLPKKEIYTKKQLEEINANKGLDNTSVTKLMNKNIWQH